jgi:YVTN family beta-propeller protein
MVSPSTVLARQMVDLEVDHPQAPDNRRIDTPSTMGLESGTGSTAFAQQQAAAPFNVYAATAWGIPHPAMDRYPTRVYVPNSNANTLTVIDPTTMKVIDQYAVGDIPHHVTPSWDMSELYVNNEGSSSLTVIDPRSGKATRTISVPFPYNLYFTPDGTKAIVVVERLSRLDFRDPHSWQLLKSVPIPYAGIDHLDFTADGRYVIGSTEWAGVLVKVDTVTMELVGSLNAGSLPVDVRLSPDGSVFCVANQGRHGVTVLDWQTMKEIQFIPTGRGAHGFQVSRDTKKLYVANRIEGSISIIDFTTRQVVGTWKTGGSPDMMQLNPDGTQLWVSGRYDGNVYVIDTRNGQKIATLRAGAGAHGLTYFPNVGNYSTGHNGVYR